MPDILKDIAPHTMKSKSNFLTGIMRTICRYRQQRIPNGTPVEFRPPTTRLVFLGVIQDAKFTRKGWTYKVNGWAHYLHHQYITVK